MPKKARKIKKSETIEIILKMLAAGIVIPAIFIFPGSALILKMFLEKNKINKNYRHFKKMLQQAKERRLVKIIEKNDELFLSITERGKNELKRYEFDDLKIPQPKHWDGVWRMVIFDIPEKVREARVVLSKKLKEMGFYQFQKSVFIHPFECENEIDFIKELFQINKYVVFLRLSSLGEYHDLILKKYFDLL